ncbi:helix-turn-helix domain-containing protein [Streptomyces sp. NPDC014882]|uniref:IclR family transcriptional regulator domain-containing protein n=1 Tax=Streptomyces sp. NPDC014882 TaxID=3364927 RepID=UPI00370032C6
MEEDLRRAPHAEPGTPPAGLAGWTSASKQELGREFIESLARGLTVLTAFGAGRAALALTEVAKATGLARATTRRALITHEHLNLVTHDATDRTFSLSPRVLSLGLPPLAGTSLPRLAEPHLRTLTDRVQETTCLASLTETGDEIQCTARVTARHVMRVDIRVGTRLPATTDTAVGRVLLTDQEHALADEELKEGVRTLAVPLHDRTGHVVAALTPSTHTARRTPRDCLDTLLPVLTTTAARIETDLHTASRFTPAPLT